MTDLRKKARSFFLTLLTEYRSPRQLAFAAAVGVFVGASPLWGLHTVLALGLAILFRLNKTAVLLGTLISNPWFAPLLIFGGLETGSLILQGGFTPLAFGELREIVQHPEWQTILQEFVKPYFFGAFVVAALLSALTFGITLKVARPASPERKKIESERRTAR